ncbi:hypothetical protein, partial [Mesorhizobium sp. M2D.F.Ca.ET.147.01.1.1]|uniref:hypothetical protein n=1 Tax=Mesorhizobium sp. M2D.F.Ca.ET.147.01.1.1 TaxID=2563934 RepID=UPI001AEEDCDF
AGQGDAHQGEVSRRRGRAALELKASRFFILMHVVLPKPLCTLGDMHCPSRCGFEPAACRMLPVLC